jgi:chromosome segregation ATPase
MQTAKTGNSPIATATPVPTSPSCTIDDCPFIIGHPVAWTGLGGSLICNFTGVVSAPYASAAAVFFGVLSLVTCFGQYRSRKNFLAEKKLVTDITAQDTEMKDTVLKVGATADALTSVGQSWEKRAQELEKQKGLVEQAKATLQKICDTLRQENEQLKANASSAAKGAQEDDAQVRRLNAETSSLQSDLTQGAASQASLDAQVRGISGGLADYKAQSGMLQASIAKVTDLVSALRRPSAGGISSGQDAEKTAANLEALTKKAQEQADGLV